MALALPIASQLHASAGITALGVMLTGQSFGALLPRLLTKDITCISSSRVVGGQGGRGGAIWWRQLVCMQVNTEQCATTQVS